MDRIASAIWARTRRPAYLRSLPARLLVAIVIVSVGVPARALMVGVTDGFVPDTSANPASTPGWTQGDPGWAHAVHFGYQDSGGPISYTTNGVYLGDGWVLSAAHNGIPTKIQFESGATFDPIPNQNFQVANPTWNDNRLVQPLADLRMIRINGDPGLPTLPIATLPLSSNDQIVTMGWGFVRQAQQSHFNVNQGTNPWTWCQVGNPGCSGPANYHGYWISGEAKRWGTNRVANSDSVLGENDGNLQTVISGGTIAYVTTYDQSSGDPFESLAVNRDSGSGVYFKRNGQWQLAGIINAKYYYSGQTPEFDPANWLAVFGNANGFADLASYNSQIHAIKFPYPGQPTLPRDYSAVADLTLDGVAGAADDIAAFVAGWRYNNGTGMGTMTSWKNGDLTHDGKTDVADFLRMRTGLSAVAGAELGLMLGISDSGGIPEPTTLILTVGPAFLFTLCGRFRRRRSGFLV